MNNKEKLLDMISKNPKGWRSWLNGQKGIILEIENYKTPNIKFCEKIYWYINNLKSYPKCLCGKDIVRFCNQKDGYAKHCSCHCAQLDEETKRKLAETNLKKYGTINPAQSKIVQDKMKATCLERYGAENVYASDYGKNKIKQTMLEKYGVENPTQNVDIRKKSKATLIKRYGITCGYHHCKDFHKSRGEQELYDFVKSIKVDARHGDRKQIFPMELDIYIPSLNIGIEYDGDYWHSLPDMIERDHKKDSICKEKNIKLIRVKECDWVKNSNEVKNMISEVLNG